jgi:hypothetical protein
MGEEILTKSLFFFVAFYRHIFRSYVFRSATIVLFTYAKKDI